MPDPQTYRLDEVQVIQSLRICWDRLTSICTCDRVLAATVFEDVVNAYSSPDRHYHRLPHIRQVLDIIARFQDQTTNPRAVQWAAWFHDVVYDPRAPDNEERSAEYAGQRLSRLGIPQDVVSAVQALILETKTHQPAGGGFDNLVFLDADLAILAASEDQYNAYAQAIRQEYAWVTDANYRDGRAKVLRGFLQRPRVFLTDTLFAEREPQARYNLNREITALEHSGT
jgi:predicted metal-dependent HD superfamily phosphohydrolase